MEISQHLNKRIHGELKWDMWKEQYNGDIKENLPRTIGIGGKW